jgi:hypothetical protein
MPAVLPRAAALAAGLLALAACQSPPAQPDFAELTYAHKPKIQLNVAEIRVERAYQPPLEPPNVEHLFPVRPAQAAIAWVEDRLVAVGDQGTATYTVRDASAVVEDLETDQSLSDYFTTEQAERYTARILVELSVERPERTGQLTVTAKRATTVPEGASVNDRRRVWYDMTEKQMDELDAELEQTLRGELGWAVLAR